MGPGGDAGAVDALLERGSGRVGGVDLCPLGETVHHHGELLARHLPLRAKAAGVEAGLVTRDDTLVGTPFDRLGVEPARHDVVERAAARSRGTAGDAPQHCGHLTAGKRVLRAEVAGIGAGSLGVAGHEAQRGGGAHIVVEPVALNHVLEARRDGLGPDGRELHVRSDARREVPLPAVLGDPTGERHALPRGRLGHVARRAVPHLADEGGLAVVGVESQLVRDDIPDCHELEVGGDGGGEVICDVGPLRVPAKEDRVIPGWRLLGLADGLAPLQGLGGGGGDAAVGVELHRVLALGPLRRECEVGGDGGREVIRGVGVPGVPTQEVVALAHGVGRACKGAAALHHDLRGIRAVGGVEGHPVIAGIDVDGDEGLDRGVATRGHAVVIPGDHIGRHGVGIEGRPVGGLLDVAVLIEKAQLAVLVGGEAEPDLDRRAVVGRAGDLPGQELVELLEARVALDAHGGDGVEGDELLVGGGIGRRRYREGARGLVDTGFGHPAGLGVVAEEEPHQAGIGQVGGEGEACVQVLRHGEPGHVGGAVLGHAAHGLEGAADLLGPAHRNRRVGVLAVGALIVQRGGLGKVDTGGGGLDLNPHVRLLTHACRGEVDVVARHREGERGALGVGKHLVEVPQARGGALVPIEEDRVVEKVRNIDGHGVALVVLLVALAVDGHLEGDSGGYLVELLVAGAVLQMEAARQVEEVGARDVVRHVLGDPALGGHARAHADERGGLDVAQRIGIDGGRGAVVVEEEVVGVAALERAASVAVDAHHALERDVVLVVREHAAALARGGVPGDIDGVERVAHGVVVDGAALRRRARGGVAPEVAGRHRAAGLVQVQGAAVVRARVALEEAAVDHAAGVRQIQGAARLGALVLQEDGARDREVVAGAVDGPALVRRLVALEVAVRDGEVAEVPVDGAAHIVEGLVAPEGYALDLAVGVVGHGDGAAGLLLGGVVGDGGRLVLADERERLVEVDCAAAVLGAHVGVVVDLGVLLHDEPCAAGVEVEAAALLRDVVADGAVGHLNGRAGVVGVHAAAAAALAQGPLAGVVLDVGVGHVQAAARAVHGDAAAVGVVGLVARHGNVDEDEGRPRLHLDAAAGVVAVAARDEAPAGDGLAGKVRHVAVEALVGELLADKLAVEDEPRVLIEPEDRAARALGPVAVDLVAVHQENGALAGGDAEGSLLVPVGVHDHHRPRKGRVPGFVERGVDGARVLLVVAVLRDLGQGWGGQRKRERREDGQGKRHKHDRKRAPPVRARRRGAPQA